MDARSVLEKLLESGKELAAKGRNVAEEKLRVPASGDERDAMISGLGKGALAGGLLAVLLGTRGGRRLTGKAVKYGSLAALGAVAFRAYQDWQQTQAASEAGPPPVPSHSLPELDGVAAERRSITLIKAMVTAAKADGHVDAQEYAAIERQLEQLDLGIDVRTLLTAELQRSRSAAELAAELDGPEAAVEVYLVSRMIMDEQTPAEQQYLRDLALALGLSADLVQRLELEHNA